MQFCTVVLFIRLENMSVVCDKGICVITFSVKFFDEYFVINAALSAYSRPYILPTLSCLVPCLGASLIINT